MAAVPFPLNPNIGQVYTYNGLRYIWDGRKWVFGPAVGGGASQMPTGPGLWAWNGTLQQWVAVTGGDMAAFPTTAGNWVWNGTSQLWVPLTSSLIRGVTDGSNAGPGMVGEYLFAENNSASTAARPSIIVPNPAGGSAFTPNQWTSVVQLTLTPGDWDVGGSVAFDGPGTPALVANVICGAAFSTLPNTPLSNWPSGFNYTLLNLAWPTLDFVVPSEQFNGSTVRQVFLICQMVQTSTSDNGKQGYVYGEIHARRMR